MRPLRRDPATTLQLNIGLYCNQACSHCHVESSPLRKEMMDRRTAERCIALLTASPGSIRTLDLTGGAPELNSQFRSMTTTLQHSDVALLCTIQLSFHALDLHKLQQIVGLHAISVICDKWQVACFMVGIEPRSWSLEVAPPTSAHFPSCKQGAMQL